MNSEMVFNIEKCETTKLSFDRDESFDEKFVVVEKLV